MLVNEGVEFVPLLLHEAILSKLLKLSHGGRIVSGMLVASPQSGEAIVVGHVHLERQVVADKNEAAKDTIVPNEPGGDDRECDDSTQDDAGEFARALWRSPKQPQHADWRH